MAGMTVTYRLLDMPALTGRTLISVQAVNVQPEDGACPERGGLAIGAFKGSARAVGSAAPPARAVQDGPEFPGRIGALRDRFLPARGCLGVIRVDTLDFDVQILFWLAVHEHGGGEIGGCRESEGADQRDNLKAQPNGQMPSPVLSINGQHGFDDLLFIALPGLFPPGARFNGDLVETAAAEANVRTPGFFPEIADFLDVAEAYPCPSPHV